MFLLLSRWALRISRRLRLSCLRRCRSFLALSVELEMSNGSSSIVLFSCSSGMKYFTTTSVTLRHRSTPRPTTLLAALMLLRPALIVPLIPCWPILMVDPIIVLPTEMPVPITLAPVHLDTFWEPFSQVSINTPLPSVNTWNYCNSFNSSNSFITPHHSASLSLGN